MSKIVPSQPHIYEFLKKYQQDPSSRVFAPLAEAYRKAGLLDEALEIATEGLKIHPHFVGGRVALGRVLFDQGRYAEVIKQLSPLVHDAPDNLVAQGLLAESYLMLGQLVEALATYKMLLFFSPQNHETAQMVHELEEAAYEKGSLALRSDVSSFSERPASEAIVEDPEVKKAKKIQGIERLQTLLQNVERYRIDRRDRPSKRV